MIRDRSFTSVKIVTGCDSSFTSVKIVTGCDRSFTSVKIADFFPRIIVVVSNFPPKTEDIEQRRDEELTAELRLEWRVHCQELAALSRVSAQFLPAPEQTRCWYQQNKPTMNTAG